MLFRFGAVAALAGELRVGLSMAEEASELLNGFSNFSKVEDKSLSDNTLALKMNNGMSVETQNKSLIKDLLSVSKMVNENIPEMKDIINTIKMAKPDIISDLKSGAFNFALIFTDEAESLKVFKDLETVSSSIKLFLSTNKEEAESYGCPFPGLFVYSATDKNSFVMPMPKSAAGLISAVVIESFATISAENFKHFQGLEQKLFYFIDNKSTYEQAKVLFESSAKKCAGFARFLFFTPEDVPTLIPLLKVTEADYPVIVSLVKDNKGLIRNVTKENFLKSVQDINTNNAETLIFASAIPEDNATRAVKVVNTHTLADFIKADNSDVLIVFTSPTCQYCEALKPVLDRLGAILAENNVNISIGNYNAIENEETPDFVYSGVPSLFFIKKGTQEKISVPAEIRELPALLKFIASNGVSANINIDDYKKYMEESKEAEAVSEPKESEAPTEKVESSEDVADEVL